VVDAVLNARFVFCTHTHTLRARGDKKAVCVDGALFVVPPFFFRFTRVILTILWLKRPKTTLSTILRLSLTYLIKQRFE